MRTRKGLLRNVVLLVFLLASLTVQQVHSVSATASHQEITPERIIQGYGNFPRLAVAGRGADGTTPALYLVEGDKARQLVLYEGLDFASYIEAKLSSDGQHIAVLLHDGNHGFVALELVRTDTGERLILDRFDGTEALRIGVETGDFTSMVWLDAEHIAYAFSGMSWPKAYGKVWSTNLDGSEKHLLWSGPIHRILGASTDQQTLYVTRAIPMPTGWLEEGFALLNVQSGTLESLWPKEDNPAQEYKHFTLVTLPDGSLRLLFVAAKREMSLATEPPVIWLASPESRQADAVWTVTSGRALESPEGHVTFSYDLPLDLFWSPTSVHELVFLAHASAPGGVWRVDLEAKSVDRVPAPEDVHRRLLAWMAQGIVTQSGNSISLLDQTGAVKGEISFSESGVTTLGIQKVNWPVPYIHQTIDVPPWFDGHWACGPTSAVMGLAYSGRLPGATATYWGWYVPNIYTQRCACLNRDYTFDTWQYDATGITRAYGAYGACIWNGFADWGLTGDYIEKHDVGHRDRWNATGVDDEVRRQLDAGAVVVVATQLLGYGHVVLVRGYDSAGNFIVNDPAGYHYSWQRDGEGVLYTWAEMNPRWLIFLYPPEFLPDLQAIQGSRDSTITVASMDHYAGAGTKATICLMNTSGWQFRRVNLSIPSHGNQSISLLSQTGNWEGSAVVKPYNLESSHPHTSAYGATSVVVNTTAIDRDAYEGIRSTYFGSVSGGGVGATLYLPSMLYNYYGWSTHIYLENTGGTATTAWIYYYRPDGSYLNMLTRNLQPLQREYVLPWQFDPYVPVNLIGSAKVISSNAQLLAATVVHERGAGYTPMSMEYSVPNAGGQYGFLPSLLRAYWSWTSAYVLRAANANASGTTYFYPNGTSWGFNLANGDASQEVYLGNLPTYIVPSGFHGSGVVAKTGGTGQVVVVGQHSNDTTAMGLRAPRGGYKELTMPYINSNGETGALTIQNVTPGTSVSVTVRYYNTNGGLVLTYNILSLAYGTSVELLPGSGVPTGFQGSIWIQASQNNGSLGATVQQSINNDQGYGYSAP